MLTSPKYVFVMYKGCLASFVTESLGKIKLYSVLPLFLPLVSSKAFPDLLQLFEDLHFCEQSLQEEYSEETEKLANTMNISTSIRK